jgi:hypothetical protein
VSDVAELAATLALDACAASAVNAFSDDTYGLFALAELIRSRLSSHSHVVDDTDEADVVEPIFINGRAKQLHPTFRRLADNLLDAA